MFISLSLSFFSHFKLQLWRLFVLFGSSTVQFSFSNGGWGATLSDMYARKAYTPSVFLDVTCYIILYYPYSNKQTSHVNS